MSAMTYDKAFDAAAKPVVTIEGPAAARATRARATTGRA